MWWNVILEAIVFTCVLKLNVYMNLKGYDLQRYQVIWYIQCDKYFNFFLISLLYLMEFLVKQYFALIFGTTFSQWKLEQCLLFRKLLEIFSSWSLYLKKIAQSSFPELGLFFWSRIKKGHVFKTNELHMILLGIEFTPPCSNGKYIVKAINIYRPVVFTGLYHHSSVYV